MSKAKAKPAPKPPKLTPAQMLLLDQLRGARIAAVPELKFHPLRKWRIDAAVMGYTASACSTALAVEIDGGAYIRGRHARGAGIEADNEKIAALAALGWRFIRVTPRQVNDGTALRWIREAL